MRFLACWLMCILIAATATHAQQLSHPLSLDGGDSFFLRKQALPQLERHDTLRILAIMVQFQPDSDSRTSGDGTFDFTQSSDTVFDAPPHNREYFNLHMKFADNYFRRVSNGRLVVESDIVDRIFTLPNKMQAYAPPLTGNDYSKLVQLVSDAWRYADTSGTPIDFSRYNTFIVFHAGAGRDFDLSAQGNPLPFNLPSIYLNLTTMQKYNGASFEGIPVQGGRFLIPSTMILPETERFTVGEGIFATSVDYGWNGLLAAMIGSHLGLPDLYNTGTGQSGIGRFGLMDGASFFSYHGLFPPEPSAWERIALGWASPVVLPSGTSAVRLHAVGLHDGSDSVIFKIPINSREYYLIENRNRDPQHDGQLLTMVVNGATVTKRFRGDTSDIALFNEDSPNAVVGVLVDVEDYDWSLPGAVDSSNTVYDGGILIWHIDENVIDASYATNTINSNPARRGVDLEEADGSQDIGQLYGILDAGAGSEYGTLFDFWYAGNRAPLYMNRFDATTHPPALTNSFLPSHVSIVNFSSRNSVMSATVRIGDDQVQPLAGYPKKIGLMSAPPVAIFGTPTAEPLVVTSTSAGFFGFSKFSGTPYGPDVKGWVCDSTGLIESPAHPLTDITLFPPDMARGVLTAFAALDPVDRTAHFLRRGDGFCNSGQSIPVVLDGQYHHTAGITAVMSMIRDEVPVFLLGDSLGSVTALAYPGIPQANLPPVVGQAPVVGFLGPVPGDTTWAVMRSTAITTSSGVEIRAVEESILFGAAGDVNGDGNREIVFITSAHKVYVYSFSGTLVSQFTLPITDAILGSPALADIDHDGKEDIVLTAGRSIYAFKYSGASVDFFPVEFPADTPVTTPAVAGDIDGDGNIDIIAGLTSGIVAVNSKGKVLTGFPLATGGAVVTPPMLFSTLGRIALTAGCADSTLYAWQFAAQYVDSLVPWPAYLHDAMRSNTNSAAPPPKGLDISEFFPKSRVYNWPNPVYEGKTYIRYYLGTAATVTIKIYDIAGDKVAEFTGPGVGGIDNEVEWNVQSVQPGIYLARVEAQGTAGSGLAYIKVAVVR